MKDQRTENYLTRGGYAFRFVENYELKRIDLKAAVANPARLHKALDDDRVIKMSLAMVDGVPFPAIVVFSGDPFDELVTGAHRVGAADLASLEVLDAYVVLEHDPYRRALLIRSINVIEGRAPTQAESLAQIAEMIRLFPDSSRSDLGLAFGVKSPAISDYLHLQDLEQRAERLGCRDAWNRLPGGLRLRLGRIHLDNVFSCAVETIGRTRLNGKPAEALIDTVRKSRTEGAAIKMLEDVVHRHVEEQERAKAKFGKRPKQAICTKWFARLKSIWRFLPSWNVASLHFGALPASSLQMNISIVRETIEQLEDVEADLRARLSHHEKEAEWRTRSPGAHPSPGISPLM